MMIQMSNKAALQLTEDERNARYDAEYEAYKARWRDVSIRYRFIPTYTPTTAWSSTAYYLTSNWLRNT